MTRAEWQTLALSYVAVARSLLAGSHWGTAYYLGGYAVEFGLKACVLKRLAADPGLIFEDVRFAQSVRSHKLEELFAHAGLRDERDAATDADPGFDMAWEVVRG